MPSLLEIVRELEIETEAARPDVDFDPAPYHNRGREKILWDEARALGALDVLRELRWRLSLAESCRRGRS
jgi:hypothetical protein